MKVEIDIHIISFVIIGICLLKNSVHSEYKVAVSSESEFVNEGDYFMAYCNIPYMGALDILDNLIVRWLHNGKPLTKYCELLSRELVLKYACNVESSGMNNISFRLMIFQLKIEDTGFLECEVMEKTRENGSVIRNDLVAKLPVPIRLREPIKSMVFVFDSSREESLTQYDSENPYRVMVLPGNYSPSCTVNGSMPLADVTIMMGDTQMPGIVGKDNNEGSQYVANETEFRDKTQTNIKCTSEVPGLPNSKMERTFQIVVRSIIMKPKITCSNDSAIVNNKRHVITCIVSGVEGVTCNKVVWQRGNNGENIYPGGYNNNNIACKEFNTSMIETTLEILQVTPEDFKVPLRVIYNDELYGIIEYDLQVPQRENSCSGKPTSIFGDIIAFYVFLYVLHLL
ncbi:uncharacterized protein LOC111115962 [Crassostrea virginica]